MSRYLEFLLDHTELILTLLFRSGEYGDNTSIPFVNIIINIFSQIRDLEIESYNSLEEINDQENDPNDLYQPPGGTPQSVLLIFLTFLDHN